MVRPGKTMNVTLELGTGSLCFTAPHAVFNQVGGVGVTLKQVSFAK